VKGALGLETARLLGARIVADIGFHPDPKVRINNGTPRTLTVDAGLIDEHPDLVARFQALAEALGGSKNYGPGVLEQQWKMSGLLRDTDQFEAIAAE
jgi:hypothetical protein